MAGRRRQPVDLIVAKGSAHMTKAEIEARRQSEVKAPSDAVYPPEYLTRSQKAAFRKIAGQLIDIGIMSNLDCATLAQYLQSYDRYLRYDKLLEKALIDAENGTVDLDSLKGLESVRDKTLKQCRALASDLGLTITSRCKLAVPQKEQVPKQNKFVQFEVRRNEGTG